LVYVLTGAEQSEVYQKRFERLNNAGPHKIIKKPFSPMDLLGIIESDINEQRRIGGKNPLTYQLPNSQS